MLNTQPALLAAATGLLMAGCSNNLYIAHETVVGLDAAINSEQLAGHLMFGYDRDFVTVIPKSVPLEPDQEPVEVAAVGPIPDTGASPLSDDEGPEQAREVMSVYSCSRLVVTGILLTDFKEELFTGDAASTQAQELMNLENCNGDQTAGTGQNGNGDEK